MGGMMETKISVFRGKEIRKVLHQDKWWFSVSDVVEVLTDSADPKQYIKKMRQRDPELNSYWGTICTPLEILAPDGKMRATNCANTEGIFRIIQSIPSPKAEPFKRWLAKVGYERVQEIEDPELASQRTRMLYRAKGYSDAWIEKRMRGIAVRAELTEEWKKRGVKKEPEYAILISVLFVERGQLDVLDGSFMTTLNGKAETCPTAASVRPRHVLRSPHTRG
jgi:hypothetical protein